ncbi:hypothetical protein AQUCO_00201114v1 [Aquilegia coerulea]|uniref:Uncharacterized protein n=1 Tax=Aquilegia coerulea TaxID=218851 RepID=A0A2G5F6A4_AQUCA|nr:hypothetical protein AQUCO_00201114v1 [Aquilegia coerulea]
MYPNLLPNNISLESSNFQVQTTTGAKPALHELNSTMETVPLGSKRFEEPEFKLREWALKSNISRENTKSRRFSASNITSFREETRSFRSNATISSTASSPGYNFGCGALSEEIDPSTYSFTTALRALQARAGFGWECLSPDHTGYALNSKWNEAEKYICNPLSGEVPLECLSAKTLSGRFMSIPSTLSRTLALSGPLLYSSHARTIPTKASTTVHHEDEIHESLIQEKKAEKSTRDVGTQSTPPELSSSSPSPASTPSIRERPLKHYEVEDVESSNSTPGTIIKFYAETQENEMKKGDREKDDKAMCKRKQGGGCLSWIVWMRKRQRGKHKPRWKVLFGNNRDTKD